MTAGLEIEQGFARRGIERLQRAFEYRVDTISDREQRARIDGALPQQEAVKRVSCDKNDFSCHAPGRRLFENAEVSAVGRGVTFYSLVAFAGDFWARGPL